MKRLTAGVLAGAALLAACASEQQGKPIDSGPFMDECPSGSLLSAATGKGFSNADAQGKSPFPESEPRYQGKICFYRIHSDEEGFQPRAIIYFTGTGTTAETVWRDLKVDKDIDLAGADSARARDDGMTVFTVDGRVVSTLVKDDLASSLTLARVVLGTD